MKYFLILIFIGLSFYDPMFIPMGVTLFFLYIMFIGVFYSPDKYRIQDGVIVTDIKQDNNNTYLTLSNGEKQMFQSTNVTIAGNVITVG